MNNGSARHKKIPEKTLSGQNNVTTFPGLETGQTDDVMASDAFDSDQYAISQIWEQSAVIAMIGQALNALIPGLKNTYSAGRIQKAVHALSSVESKLDEIVMLAMPSEEVYQMVRKMADIEKKSGAKKK